MMGVMEDEVTPATGMGPEGDLAVAALTLARRFAAGGTMWCLAPQWPSHARHVAVEFVHPVIVGKRALPAVSLEATGDLASLRLLSRPGDVLLLVGAADTARVTDLLWRCEAWGLTSLWIGAGTRPTMSRADQLVWLDDTDGARAARSGDMVLIYHLLWELTHVVLEHPGLLVPEPECTDDVCITCSDEGRVAEVRAVHDDGSVDVMALGHTETIDASLVDPVRAGDLLLVHAGVAISTLGALGS
jgi:hydrogenase maturation factor